MQDKGFTLIELIVVMAVFLFIIGAAISIFISVVQNQERILSEQQLLNQVSYTMEYMSKALRMAARDTNGSCLGSAGENYNYLLTRPNISTGFYQGIKFINESNGNACQEFFWDNNSADPYYQQLVEETNNDLTTITPITSSKLNINYVKFGIDGIPGTTGNFTPVDTTGIQPRVTITLSIGVQGQSSIASQKFQTTVSQRDLNIPQ